MDLSVFFAIVTLLITTALSLLMLIYAWQSRRDRVVQAFTLVSGSISLWCLGYTIELLAPNMAVKLTAVYIQYAGIMTIAVNWLIFASIYVREDGWINRRSLLILYTIPVTVYLLLLTNSWHGWVFHSFAVRDDHMFGLIVGDRGWAWYLQATYSYLLLLGGTAVFLNGLRRATRIYRWQLLLLTIAPLLPWTANILYLINAPFMPALDLSPFSFVLANLILALAVFRYQIFSLTPVARSVVVDTIRAAVLVIDGENRVVDLNAAGEKLFAKQSENVIGKPVGKLMGRWNEQANQYMDVYQTREEIVLEMDDGRNEHFNLQISPIHNHQNQLVARVVVLQNITAEKQAEEALAMAQAKTKLLAKVNHELRNPLNAILGIAEMLDHGVYGEMNDTQRTAVAKIITQSAQLSDLVDNLLEQTRLEKDDFYLNHTEFLLSDLIHQIENGIGPQMRRKELHFTAEIDPRMPKILLGDPTRIHQIIANLLDNAVKYTPAGGTVTLQIRRKDEQEWTIRITDTGIGIAPARIDYIFQPFTQATDVNAHIQGETGLGLGLAIVFQLTRVMKGRIDVESELDEGSTFTVTLPLKPDRPDRRSAHTNAYRLDSM